jgi:hypothetical protein
MKLLRQINEDVSYGKDGKDYYITGIFMQSEIVNKNGRKYPESVLDRECERYIKEYVEKNRAYGELNHPTDNPAINLERVSHLIVELEKKGKNWVGKAKILDTDKGKIVKAIIDGGGKLAVSSRALGSLMRENGVDVVQDDFKLLTAADIVAEPSAPEAFVEAVMEEVDWEYDEKLKKYIPKNYEKILEEFRVKQLKEFIYKLRNR